MTPPQFFPGDATPGSAASRVFSFCLPWSHPLGLGTPLAYPKHPAQSPHHFLSLAPMALWTAPSAASLSVVLLRSPVTTGVSFLHCFFPALSLSATPSSSWRNVVCSPHFSLSSLRMLPVLWKQETAPIPCGVRRTKVLQQTGVDQFPAHKTM